MKTLLDILDLRNGDAQLLYVANAQQEIIASTNLSDLKQKINRLSFYLISNDIQKNDLVVIIIKNGISFLTIDFALAQTGAISVPLYENCYSTDLKFILEQCQPKLVVAENIFIQQHRDVLKDYKVFEIEQHNKLNLDNNLFDVDLYRRLSVVKSELNENDILTIIFTSGTTGNPKGVMLSHKSIMHNIKCLARDCFVPEGENVLSFLPLNHVFGRVFSYVYLFQGANIYFLDPLSSISSACKKFKPFAFNVVPTILERIFNEYIQNSQLSREEVLKQMEHLENESFNYIDFTERSIAGTELKNFLGNNIHHICCGSSRMPYDAAKYFIHSGIGVIEGYGMTEMSPMISYSRLKNENKIGTVGKPIDNTEIKFSKQGEILVKGDGLFSGYYNNGEDTVKSFDSEYFKTGDSGYIDDDGYLVVNYRLTDNFKLPNGKYFNPSILESEIVQLKEILQVAIIDQQIEGALTVITILDPQRKFKIEELIDIENSINKIIIGTNLTSIVRFHFLFFKIPFSIENGLLTPTSKLKRYAIQNSYDYLAIPLKQNHLITEMINKLMIDDAEVEIINNCKSEFELFSHINNDIEKYLRSIEINEIENYFSVLKNVPQNENIIKVDETILLRGNNNHCFNI